MTDDTAAERVRVRRIAPERSNPCNGRGCRNDATWSIGVPVAVMFVCDLCADALRRSIVTLAT